MFTIKKYATVHSLDEAYELLHKNRNNIILGGLMWMKMGNRNYHTGIDLSNLGLNTIEETEDEVIIGCMTTLRQIETSDILIHNFSSVLPLAVKDIVGVQFRNSATIGASVFSKYGFSDILTSLLVLDTTIELYHGGILSLEEFIDMKVHKDILVRIRIKKHQMDVCFKCQRYSATDFSLINMAASYSKDDGQWKVAVGARPGKARLAYNAATKLSKQPDDNEIDQACETMAYELTFGSNIKASKTYRLELAKVLMKRGIKELCI